MDSPSTELALAINAGMEERCGGLSDVQLGALGQLLETWKLKRDLKAPHVLQPDETPYRHVITLTMERDETTEEHDERMAAAEKRAALYLWTLDPEDQPPPPGAGFHHLKDQKIWWVTKAGNVLKIAEMTLSHRRNLLAFLERNAEALKMSEDWALVSSFPDDPSDGVADALDQIQGEMEQTPTGKWLRKLPLVKALRKSIKADEEAAVTR